jgi:hypothetical protein
MNTTPQSPFPAEPGHIYTDKVKNSGNRYLLKLK